MRGAIIAMTSYGAGYLWGWLQLLLRGIVRKRAEAREWRRASTEAQRHTSAGGRREYRNLVGRLMWTEPLQAGDFTSLQKAEAVARHAASAVPTVLLVSSALLGGVVWCFGGQGLSELLLIVLLSMTGTGVAQLDLRRFDATGVDGPPVLGPYIWLPTGVATAISLWALRSRVGLQPWLLASASLLFAFYVAVDAMWCIKSRLRHRRFKNSVAMEIALGQAFAHLKERRIQEEQRFLELMRKCSYMTDEQSRYLLAGFEKMTDEERRKTLEKLENLRDAIKESITSNEVDLKKGRP